MKSLRTRAIVGAVALASTFAIALLSQAGVAGAFSQSFRIYNVSSHPLKLAGVGCNQSLYCWEGRPRDGAVLKPGEGSHDWELKRFVGRRWTAHVVYDIVGTNAQFSADLYSVLPGHEHTYYSTCATGIGRCNAGGDTIYVLDPPGTSHVITAGQAQEQADTLRELCTKTNSAKCEFKPTREDKTNARGHLVGAPVANCLDTDVKDSVAREDRVGVSNSVGIEVGAEAEGNFIVEKAKLSVTTKYRHEWTEEHTFKQDVELTVKPGYKAWVTSAPPVYRDTGDFTLELGNTTWTLRDVYFDTPDPDRTAEFTVDQSPLSAKEYKERCSHVPPGSSGLRTVPASWVSIHHVGSGGHDRMVGGPESNTMRGLRGNDAISGVAGNDRLFGGAGDDQLSGGTGDDLLLGGSGPDTLDGGPGSDTMIDTSGPTVMQTGTDTGRGRDDVDVHDGRGDDTVTCETRRSRVVADPGDQILGPCGSVIRRGPATGPGGSSAPGNAGPFS